VRQLEQQNDTLAMQLLEHSTRCNQLEIDLKGTEYLREEIVKQRQVYEEERRQRVSAESERDLVRRELEDKTFRLNEIEVVIEDLKKREAQLRGAYEKEMARDREKS
jgi:chromosome segregation ATPase